MHVQFAMGTLGSSRTDEVLLSCVGLHGDRSAGAAIMQDMLLGLSGAIDIAIHKHRLIVSVFRIQGALPARCV